MNQEQLRGIARNGGVDLRVKRLDGTEEEVRVRFLPRAEFPAFVEVVDNEPESINLVCGKAGGWSEMLSDESFDEVLETVRSINLERALAYAHRALALQRRLLPDYKTAVEINALRQALPKLDN